MKYCINIIIRDPGIEKNLRVKLHRDPGIVSPIRDLKQINLSKLLQIDTYLYELIF